MSSGTEPRGLRRLWHDPRPWRAARYGCGYVGLSLLALKTGEWVAHQGDPVKALFWITMGVGAAALVAFVAWGVSSALITPLWLPKPYDPSVGGQDVADAIKEVQTRAATPVGTGWPFK